MFNGYKFFYWFTFLVLNEKLVELQDIQLRVAAKESSSKTNKLNDMLIEEHISSQYRFSLRVKLLAICLLFQLLCTS